MREGSTEGSGYAVEANYLQDLVPCCECLNNATSSHLLLPLTSSDRHFFRRNLGSKKAPVISFDQVISQQGQALRGSEP